MQEKKEMEFCTEYNLVLTNIWFNQHDRRRLFTRKKPGNIGKHEVDLIKGTIDIQMKRLALYRLSRRANQTSDYPNTILFLKLLYFLTDSQVLEELDDIQDRTFDDFCTTGKGPSHNLHCKVVKSNIMIISSYH